MSDRTRPGFATGILTSVAIFAVFASPIVHGAVYSHDDLLNFHLPLRAFYASELAEGRIPTWIPHLFCGFNLHGEGQLGLLHPLHLLLYATLPLPLAFMIEIILPFSMMQLGMFWLLRRRGLDRDAAVFGSINFAFAPALMLRFVHMNATAVIAHLPWLLVAIDVFVHSSGRRRRLAGLAVAGLTASQILLGYPAYVWYSVLTEGLYALWLLVPGSNWRSLLSLSLLKLLGVMLGAVQLIPTMERVAWSLRRNPLASSGDVTSRRELFILSQWFDPYLVWYRVPLPAIAEFRAFFMIHETSLYCGAAVPVLATWILLRWRQGTLDRRLILAAVTLGLLALGLAFIRLTPLWEVYRRVPVINLFRFNVRYYILFVLAAAVVAAVGMADLAALVGRRERVAWRLLWPLAMSPLISSGLAVGGLLATRVSPKIAGSVSAWPLNVLGPALACSAALLAIAAARGRRWAPAALIALTAVDLGIYDLSHVLSPLTTRPGMPASATIAGLTSALPELPGGPGYRVLDSGATDRLLLQGFHLAGGYVGLAPATALDYAHDAKARRVAAVGAVLLVDPDGNPLRWERATDPLSRVRLVSRARTSRDPKRDLVHVDPAIEGLVPAGLGLVDGNPGTAEIASDRGTRIEVTVIAPSRQLLILSEAFDPGWEVWVDGRRDKIVPVYGDFLGCAVDPGRHVVDFRYRPWSLRLGMIVSLSALGLLTLWFLLESSLAPPRYLRGPENQAGHFRVGQSS